MSGSLDRGAAAGCLLLGGAVLSAAVAVALFVLLVKLVLWAPGLVVLVALACVLYLVLSPQG